MKNENLIGRRPEPVGISWKTRSYRKRKGSQLDLFSKVSVYVTPSHFGGSTLKSHPKRARPIKPKKLHHVVMKSLVARGKFSMLSGTNSRTVKSIVYKNAGRFGVAIDQFENVGNHLHIAMRPSSQKAYTMFIKATSGAIALFLKKLGLNYTKGKFWEARPFSRLVNWGVARLRLLKYLNSNRIEAVGFDVFVREQIQLSG